MSVSAIILSAGESTRMGTPKAFLGDINSLTFIENQIKTYRTFGCNEIVVIVNENVLKFAVQNNIDCFNQVVIITNKKLEWGRFYSLKIGIKALVEKEFCFIHNVDNPLNDKLLLEKIYHARKNADVIVPINDSKTGHPILINKTIISKINSESRNNLKINEFLTKFKKKTIDVNYESIHYNINTYNEYKAYISNY